MRIKHMGFNACNHSWSLISQNFARQFKIMGHEVDIFSTNGNKYFPNDLKTNLIGFFEEQENKIVGKSPNSIIGKMPHGEYDMQFSFTALKNAPIYFKNGNKNRFLMWSYEWDGNNILPPGFAKCHNYVDKVLTISTHAKNIFINSGIPKDKVYIIPCGIDDHFINGTSIYKLNTNKKFKFLSNIAQPHMRKNFPGILEAWGKAFNKKDDVVLVLKIVKKTPQYPFEIDVDVEVSRFKKKYPNHAEILFITDFIEDISSLYRACNCLLSLSEAENFLMPALENLLSKKINIVSSYGGQMDFCSDKNSLLVKGNLVRVNPKSTYWYNPNNAIGFQADTNHAAELMQCAIKNEKELLEKFIPNTLGYSEKYSWKTISNQILSLVE